MTDPNVVQPTHEELVLVREVMPGAYIVSGDGRLNPVDEAMAAWADAMRWVDDHLVGDVA